MTNDYTSPQISVPRDELSLEHPPRGIRMERTVNGGTIIKIRLFSAATAFPILFVTLFWNSIVSVFVALAIVLTASKFGYDLEFFSKMENASEGDSIPVWFFWLFLTPFIAIGLGLLYSTVFNIFGRCEIRLGSGEGSIFSGIGSIGRTQRFSPQSVKSLNLNESPSKFKTGKNGSGAPITTHFRLVIEMNNGREIKSPDFGKIKGTWLAFALKKILGCT